MTCPHCQAPLSAVEIQTTDSQNTSIEECHNCGGHYLPPVLANFISANTAKNIDSIIPQSTSVPSTTPICPHCRTNMTSIKDDSVPQTVTVFACPNNHGEFYPKGQLLLFKKAQEAKINFHKLWGIPLKSAFAVIIPVVIIFSAITVIPNVLELMKSNTESRVKADEILTQPLITPISATQILISFSTKQPAITSITFTEGRADTQEISNTYQTNHLISIPDLTPQTLYKYRLNIRTANNQATTSDYTFSTP